MVNGASMGGADAAGRIPFHHERPDGTVATAWVYPVIRESVQANGDRLVTFALGIENSLPRGGRTEWDVSRYIVPADGREAA